MSEHTLHTVWLLLCGKIGSQRNVTLVRNMTPHDAYHATKAELMQVLKEKDAAYFLNKDLRAARELIYACEEKGMRVVCYHDADYPPALREIEDPPVCLFYYGTLPKPDLPTVGIVGTRNCTRTAAGLAASFSCSLALSGFQVISGMANGIDTYAHKGSLVKGIGSFAVLGCGADLVYPKQNEELYNLLREHGGLISEYPPGTPPLAANFPRRNRIISGISDGVLVVECPQKSGSMSTARYTVEQNRLLFAVPSAPNDRVNTGTNRLIKHGAIFCTEPNDIFKEFLPRYADRIRPTAVRFALTDDPNTAPVRTEPTQKRQARTPRKKETVPTSRPVEKLPVPPPLSAEETKVYQAFGETEALSADDLCQRSGLPFHRILPLLQALEMSGYVEPCSGGMFRRK